MDLANHAASLNSSRGAAFGFAGIAKLAGEQLAPYVTSMVPKLYRWGNAWKALMNNLVTTNASFRHWADKQLAPYVASMVLFRQPFKGFAEPQ